VLLQLNLAFYVPSIPALLLLGRAEARLNASMGAAASMALRLGSGLAGCAAVCAALPFLPARLPWLLGATAGMGAASAVAFSASYQLVSWFRAADVIALGLGCSGSGPVALLIQLAMHSGASPRRWQSIAVWEIAAGVVIAGAAATASLFGQARARAAALLPAAPLATELRAPPRASRCRPHTATPIQARNPDSSPPPHRILPYTHSTGKYCRARTLWPPPWRRRRPPSAA